MKFAIVIPARMGASRFPGKPLVDLCGKPMVQWVYEAALQSGVTQQIAIATPDQEIVEAAKSFGASAILTRHDHASGTDRIAEAAEYLSADVFINVQGDEPLIPAANIAACAKLFLDSPEIDMGSVYCPCLPEEEPLDSCVKVVLDKQGFALYFSRFAIPYPRQERVAPVHKHLGLYGYKKAALQNFSQWPMGELERAESLEQLRFMENGIRIKMAAGEPSELAVDTPDQANQVRAILDARL